MASELPKELFRSLVESTGDVFYVLRLEPSRSFEFVSDTVFGHIGYTSEELLADPDILTRLVHPDDVDVLAANLAVPVGADIAVDLRWIHRDGEIIWTRHRSRKRLRGDGSVVIEGSSRDVTDIVRTKNEFAASERRYRLLVEESNEIVSLHEPDGTLRWVSPAMERLLGWSEEALGRRQLLHEDDADKFAAVRRDLEAGADSGRARVRLLRADGTYLWVDATARPIRDDAGTITSIIVVTRDVHEQVLAELALADSEERLRATLDSLVDPHVVLEPIRDPAGAIVDFTFVEANVAACRYFGRARAELVGTALLTVRPDLAGSGMLRRFGEVLEAGVPLSVDDVRIPDSRATEPPWLDIRAVKVGGNIASTWRDVTDRHSADEELRRSERRFRIAMESAPEGIAVLDLDRSFLEVNPALCAIVGRDEEWLLRHSLTDILYPGEEKVDLHMRAEVLSGAVDSISHEKRLIHADGSVVWVDHAIGLLRDDDGNPLSYVSQFDNVTEERKARERLEFLASHDDLTGFVTRAVLRSRLERMMHVGRGSDRTVAALFLDMDGMKAINDTYGHAAGDTVLREIAARIRARVRPDDVVSRVGGDEFVVALPAFTSDDDVMVLARRLAAATFEPVVVGEEELSVSMSIGIARAAADEPADDLLHRADQALYRAKRRGRGQVANYDRELDGLPEGDPAI